MSFTRQKIELLGKFKPKEKESPTSNSCRTGEPEWETRRPATASGRMGGKRTGSAPEERKWAGDGSQHLNGTKAASLEPQRWKLWGAVGEEGRAMYHGVDSGGGSAAGKDNVDVVPAIFFLSEGPSLGHLPFYSFFFLKKSFLLSLKLEY